jgi:uncharacterized protein YjbI with pentapeptide repeats
MATECTRTDAFRGAGFRVADLTGATFRDCDLTEVRIVGWEMPDLRVSGGSGATTVHPEGPQNIE